jgi:glycosyltransferase involved in cell wall biosynthesis
MTSGDKPKMAPTPDSALTDFIRPEVRDAVIFFRPSSSTMQALVESAPAPGELALLCAHDSLAELRELIRQTEIEAGPQSIVFFHGGIAESLRVFPLRWRLAVITGAAEEISSAELGELADSLASNAMLVWHRPDLKAEKLLDNLIATGTAQPDQDRSKDFRVLRTSNRLPRLAASARPADWSMVRTLLIERDFLNAEPSPGPQLTDILHSLRLTCLMDDAVARSGYASWPYQAPTPYFAIPSGLPDERPWPRISIVTPSLNQGRFIEETILSVLGQGYPNLEYIVIDGASTDETSAVLERYRDKLDCVVSEKDDGQSHAINKGMAIATGEILTWLNSDDMLAPGALFAMAIAFATSRAEIVAGIAEIYRDGKLISEHLTACGDGPLPLDDLLDLDCGWNAGQFFYQPEVFFTRELWHRAGGYVDTTLFYSMDYELWLRFATERAQLHVIGRPIARYRQHDDQKTSIESRFKAELITVRQRFLDRSGYQPVANQRSLPVFSRRLRVTSLNDSGWHYGAGIAHERLAKALRRAGCDVSAVALREETLSSGKGYAPTELSGHIAEHEPDLVLLGNVHGANISPFVLSEVFDRWPSLIVLHDLWWLTGRCTYPSDCERYRTGCDASCPTPDQYPQLAPDLIAGAWNSKRLLCRSARPPVLLGQSAWTVDMTRSAFSETDAPPIERISYGFPVDLFRPRDRQACREMLDLPQDRFIVLFSATSITDERKGADQVRSLVRGLRLPGLLFVAIGLPASEQLDVPPDIFRALGYVEDPEKIALIYAAADIIVAPSREETFGQIYVEAIASGTPAVGHGLTGTADALLDGMTGLKTKAPDAESLETAVIALYRDRTRRDAMAFWGRVHAENEWSLEACAQHFFATLRRLGLVDALGLPHRIEFQRGPSEPEAVEDLHQSTKFWKPINGVGGREGPLPEHGLPRQFHWCLGPKAEIDLVVQQPGRYLVLLDCMNRLSDNQLVTLSIDGHTVAQASLPTCTNDDGFLVDTIVELSRTRNRLEISFDKWREPDAGERRPLAMVLQSLHMLPFQPIDLCQDGIAIDVRGHPITDRSAVGATRAMSNFFVIIPTFNSAEFLERCLASIILIQPGNFGVRVHVQDAQSTDDTVKIAEAWATRNVTISSERDNGLYDALTRAATRLRPGEIMTWLGSDDVLLPGTLATVASIFDQLPEVQWLTGLPFCGNEVGEGYTAGAPTPYIRADLAAGKYDGRSKGFVMQEGSFWRGDLWHKVGGVDPHLKLAGDWDLWRRFAQQTPLYAVTFPLGRFTRRKGQKSEDMEPYYLEIDASREASPVDDFCSYQLSRYAFAEEWIVEKQNHRNSWIPISGVGVREGAIPEHGLPRQFHWCLGPRAEIDLLVERPGRYLVFLDCMNRMFDNQLVTLSIDGHTVAHTSLPQRTNGDGFLFDTIVELGQTRNRLEISFDKWREPDASDRRPLAMVLQSVHVLPFQPIAS